MVDSKCNTEEYWTRAGRCCDRCPAGSFVRADCDHTGKTQCDDCRRGLFTATRNSLRACRVCKSCSASNNQMTAEPCTADKDTVCKCASGFFCIKDSCDHCMPATSCPRGTGVKVQTRGTKDTICAPCGNGTYSNVSDSFSACQTHTRCDDLGRVLKSAGTSTADAICGEFKSGCSWILPAGLWLGFVLSILVVLGLMCWRAKRKSYKAARSNASLTEARTITESSLEPALQTHKTFDQCQKSNMTEACQFTLLNLDESATSSTELSEDLPLTLKTDGSEQRNGTDAYHRSRSEPQEDEWCGT
ncbi:tumor necrosis factor receptor superfamily member 5 [Syngnathus acus]|uniref:tumor necrosis factor receptor superfamily member 5 n=1 Tax=Syngnathus acus TaxID=161584 RepID=UPI001886440D|nr:tumor necrosis factor receptor superfamily member 5 [Syngnathus acus]